MKQERLEPPKTRHRKSLQFNLSTLLLLVLAVAVIARFPWLIGLAQFYIVAGLPLLPVFPVIQSRFDGRDRSVGGTVIAAGVLLLLHLVTTAGWIEYIRRESYYVDHVPWLKLVQTTLNWTIPLTFVGVIIGLALTRRTQQRLGVIIGGVILVGASFGFFLYGIYFFESLMGDSMRDRIWWF